MARDTWRDEDLRGPERQRGDATSREAGATRHDSAAESSAETRSPGSILQLPSALAGHWRVEQELVTRGSEADLLLVVDAGGDRRVAKIYRAGIEPKTEVLRRVGGTSYEHIVRLFDYGKSDGRWYELLEYVEHGSLEDLIRQEGPRLEELRIGQILVELLKAIDHLHSNDVVHRDIKPSNILVRSLRPLDLVLIDFGIASVLGDGSRRFTSSSRTIGYAAPEAAAGEVSKASDWWSLGIILVEVLTGRHPFSDGQTGNLIDDRAVMSRLAQMPVDQLVHGIEGHWRMLCRGLLRRDAKHRWADGEIVRWVRKDPTLKVVEESTPVSQEHAPFFFAGSKYHTLPEIAQAFSENWQEARKTIERGHLLNWVKDDFRDNELRQFLSDIDRDLSNLDERVFRIILKLDLGKAVFCNYRLDQQGLLSLCNEAIADQGDAKSVLRQLFELGILETIAKSTGIAQFQQMHDQLKTQVIEYQNLYSVMIRAEVFTEALADTETPLAAIMRSILPDGADYIKILRQAALRAASPAAREIAWFSELLNSGTNSVPKLLLVPLVCPVAEIQAREQRRHHEEIQKQRRYDNAYETYSRASGYSVGALCGGALGVMPAWIILNESGIVGAAITMFGFAVLGCFAGRAQASESKWVASNTRDIVEVRTKGVVITMSSIAMIGLFGALLMTYVPKKIAERKLQAQQNEALRLDALITRAIIARDVTGGVPIGETNVLTGPKTSVVVYFAYSATKDGDVATVSIVNGTACAPIRMLIQGGSAWCKWDELSAGDYKFRISINGQPFKLLSAKVTSALASNSPSPNVQQKGGPLNITPPGRGNLIGEIAPTGESTESAGTSAETERLANLAPSQPRDDMTYGTSCGPGQVSSGVSCSEIPPGPVDFSLDQGDMFTLPAGEVGYLTAISGGIFVRNRQSNSLEYLSPGKSKLIVTTDIMKAETNGTTAEYRPVQ